MQRLSGRQWTGPHGRVVICRFCRFGSRACWSESSVCPRCSALKSSRGAGPRSASLSLSSFPRNHWPGFLPGSPVYGSNWPFPHQDPVEATRNRSLPTLGGWVHHTGSQQTERALSSEVNWNQKFGTCEVIRLIMQCLPCPPFLFAFTPEQRPAGKALFIACRRPPFT